MQAEFEMKAQVIRSRGRATRLFVNVPLPLAATLDLQAEERVRWQLLSRSELRLIRLEPAMEKGRKKCLPGGQPSGIRANVSEHLYIRLTIKNMKSFAKICLVLLTAVTLAAFTTQAQTDSASSSTNKSPAAAKPKSRRCGGKIASVDSDAKTITITLANGASQTIHVTSNTKIKKDGEPGVFADAVVGEKVRASERQDDSGNWVATTVNIGEPKPKAAAAPAGTNKQ